MWGNEILAVGWRVFLIEAEVGGSYLPMVFHMVGIVHSSEDEVVGATKRQRLHVTFDCFID